MAEKEKGAVVILEGPDAKVVFNEDRGTTSTYFGGRDKADGKGHGHVDTDTSGRVTYERDAKSGGDSNSGK